MFELADPAFCRAGERTGFVAEHFRLEHRLRQRAAVHRDKRFVTPRRQFMQTACDQLLARASVAVDQHRRVGRRDIRDQPPHLLDRRTTADDARRHCVLPGQLTAQREVLQHQLAALQRTSHGFDQTLGCERLFDEVVRAVTHGLHGHRNIAMAGDQNYRHVGRALVALREQFETACARQANIADDHP
jgi:hypothetical protein